MENENKIIPTTDNPEILQAESVQEQVVTEVDSDVESKPEEKRCPNCQALLKEDQIFCSECGTPSRKFCVNCQTELRGDQAFCPQCGQRMSGEVGENQNINQFNENIFIQQQKRKKKPIVIGSVCVAIVVIAVLIAKIGGGYDFKKEFADIENKAWCTIASDGSYMKIDTNPQDIDDDSYRFDYETSFEASEEVEKINKELGFSDVLMEKMRETSSLDGRQTDENDKFKVSWSYHPDRGLEVTYEKK